MSSGANQFALQRPQATEKSKCCDHKRLVLLLPIDFFFLCETQYWRFKGASLFFHRTHHTNSFFAHPSHRLAPFTVSHRTTAYFLCAAKSHCLFLRQSQTVFLFPLQRQGSAFAISCLIRLDSHGPGLYPLASYCLVHYCTCAYRSNILFLIPANSAKRGHEAVCLGQHSHV